MEILEQCDHVDYVFACIGGGGLMSGLATWIKWHSPDTRIIGCLPERSPEMYLSVKAGKVVVLEESLDTLSDGSAGGLEEDSITFEICRKLVDEYALASEEEIADAIRFMASQHHKIVEGAAGVALACYMKMAERLAGASVAIVVCGANISSEKLKSLL